jgi:hypothetical protein
MSSDCLNDNSHLLTVVEITWSSSLIRKSWVISAFNFHQERSLIIVALHTNIYFRTKRKWSSARLSFSHHVSLHEIAHQKVENCLSSQKFDETTISSLMRWRLRQLWWDDVLFRQDWWVAFVKFDEPLHFDEMSHQARRLIIDAARQIENRHTSLDNRE